MVAPSTAAPARAEAAPAAPDSGTEPPSHRWRVRPVRSEPLWRCRGCGAGRRTSFGACVQCGQHRVVPADYEPPSPVPPAPARRSLFRLAVRRRAERLRADAGDDTPATADAQLADAPLAGGPFLLAGAALLVPATLLLRFSDHGLMLTVAAFLMLVVLGLAARCGRSMAGGLLSVWERPDWSGVGWFDFTGRVRIAVAGAGLGLMAMLLVLLMFTDGGTLHLLWWALSLLMVGVGFAGPGLSLRGALRALAAATAGRLWMRLLPAALPALLVTAAYCVVVVPNLTDWRYSAIGDEYSFYLGASNMFQTGPARVFSQSGVFEHHPQMNSVYKHLVMVVFGNDHFGWKMSGALSMAAATAGVYFLGLTMGGRRVGALSAAVFASSHYLMGLMHGGYNHMDSLPYIVWSVGTFVAGVRRRSPVLLYLSGVLLGLGLYTHYSARLIGPVLLLFSLAWVGPRGTLRFWPMGVGFLMAAAPTAMVAGTDLWTKMAAESLGNYSRDVSGPVLERLAGNAENNLPAFFRNDYVSHYVSGPLAGPISAALMALGLGMALGAVRWPAARLLLIWSAAHFVLLGMLSPYPTTAVTRLYPLMAPAALLAGLAASRLLGLVSVPVAALAGRAGPAALTALLVAALFAVNVYQLRVVTHGEFHYTPQAMAVGAQRNERCVGDTGGGLFLGAHPQGVLALALRSYTQGSSEAGWVTALDWPEGDLRPECVILVHPERVPGGVSNAELQARYPDGEFFLMRSPSGKSRMWFYNTGLGR